MNGAISLDRKILDWEWYSDKNVSRLFIHILLKANWKDAEWRGITISRGQMVTSIEHLSTECNMSFQEVRTALSKLEKTGEINKQTTNRYTLITVNKYNIYQISATNKQQTNNKQTTNKQQQLNKNNKNNKKNIESVAKRDAIVEYLNEKTGKHFKKTTGETIKHINARFDEGYTVDDFKKVIDMKTEEWGRDKKMCKYLRPDTLFRPSNFESYVNEVGSSSDEMDDWLKGGEG